MTAENTVAGSSLNPVSKPIPFVAARQDVSSKSGAGQLAPAVGPAGASTRPREMVVTRSWPVGLGAKPNETSAICGGYGANCVAMLPSGLARASDSPSAASLKFVCNGKPGILRSRLEANTTRNFFGGRFVLGKRHLNKSA